MLGILCGFAAEAAVAKKLSPLVACSGAVEHLAFQRAEKLVQDGATALVSFGVAGALAPDLDSTAILVPHEVKGKDGAAWRCDNSLVRMFARGADGIQHGAVYGSTHLVPTPREKKALHAATGCAIVDMESHVIAITAGKYALPFAVLRGVSDSVDDTFPQAALVGLAPDGSTDMKAVYKSLLKNPLQIPALMKLFKHTGIALGALEKVVSRV